MSRPPRARVETREGLEASHLLNPTDSIQPNCLSVTPIADPTRTFWQLTHRQTPLLYSMPIYGPLSRKTPCDLARAPALTATPLGQGHPRYSHSNPPPSPMLQHLTDCKSSRTHKSQRTIRHNRFATPCGHLTTLRKYISLIYLIIRANKSEVAGNSH